MHQIDQLPKFENVVLAALQLPKTDPELFNLDIEEMKQLCITAHATVVATLIQKRPHPEAATYLGHGKISEIAEIMKTNNCTTCIIDAELTPAQIRTIESIVQGKVIDRSQLILDIFAHHARTNEARIQVELAQLRTLYPRLTHAWTHFSQQVGGIGTVGPGEKQLEIDRRLVQKKITDLKDRLAKVEKSRVTQRKSRTEQTKLSLVGYTNVGKSSLLNALSGSTVLVENKLFATLDTATRRTYIQNAGSIIISDTVGFLRKLPHQLIASFKSTLEVVAESDIILLVMDATATNSQAQIDAVLEVLKDLKADTTPRILIFNKSDLLLDMFTKKALQVSFPDALFISAFDNASIKLLKSEIALRIQDLTREHAMDTLIAQKSAELRHLAEKPDTN
jgi:GTP-binding protein HflX